MDDSQPDPQTARLEGAKAAFRRICELFPSIAPIHAHEVMELKQSQDIILVDTRSKAEMEVSGQGKVS